MFECSEKDFLTKKLYVFGIENYDGFKVCCFYFYGLRTFFINSLENSTISILYV
jgi:hypothetical protein